MAPPHKQIDIGLLRASLRYEPETGKMFWIVRRGNRRCLGRAGKLDKDGYRRIGLNGKYYMAHRLIWAFVHGSLPKGQLDHINRNRDDNRIANLREASPRMNSLNKGNDPLKSGTIYLADRNRWHARIQIKKKNRHLGIYGTQAEAAAAYRGALIVAEKFL